MQAATTIRERLTATTADGRRLAVDVIAPEGPARGAVWLGHAILANRRSLDRPPGGGLASEIARAGLHVYVADWRGHGESGRGEPWRYEELLKYDFPAVTRLVRERHPGLRVGAVGHSLTGHAAAAWLGLAPGAGIDALVTIGANVWIRRLEPSRALWARKLAVLGVMGGFAAALGRVPARAFRYGSEDAPRSFVSTWLRWAREDRWAAPDGTDYLQALARVRAPVLAVLGSGDDLLCSPVSGELFHRHLSGAPVEIHVSGPAEVGYDPGHMEMVTDPRSRPLWRRIAAFLARELGGGA